MSGSDLDEVRRWSRLAKHLADYGDRSTAGQALAEAAVEVIGCTSAAVVNVVGEGRRLRFQVPGAGPDHYVERVAGIVASTGEGPALDAVATGRPVAVDDLTTDTRWPAYAEQVLAETPLRSALMYPLQLGEDIVGLLAFYDAAPGFFDETVQRTAEVYADHATIALARVDAVERVANLQRAVETNRTIGQAVGILMARYGVLDADAFDVLRLASQATHTKLRELAETVVREGDLPAGTRR